MSDLVVAEVVTIIGGRRGGKPAQTLYEYFVDEGVIEFLDEALFREARAHHLRYDGSLSLADCISVVLLSRHHIRDIVSFDRDFDKVRGIRRIH